MSLFLKKRLFKIKLYLPIFIISISNYIYKWSFIFILVIISWVISLVNRLLKFKIGILFENL